MIDFRNIPPVVKNLLIINGLFFLATYVLQNQGVDLSNYLGLHYWESPGFLPHQLVTYMFMHGGFTHLLFNMFAVWMFGRVLEQVWGQKKFLIFYMITGLAAGVTQMLVSYVRISLMGDLITPEIMDLILTEGYQATLERKNFVDPFLGNLNSLVNVVTVGASGSVYGILVAFGMLFPNTELMLLFPPIPIKAKVLVIILIVMALLLGFGNFSGDNIAHFAHLGGALAGFIMIKIWKKDRTNFY